VYCCQLLEARFAGEAGRLRWFRTQHAKLGATPFLAMVDEGRLEDVIAVLSGK